MHSLKKRLEVENQIHKADTLQIMTDNMVHIVTINELRVSIQNYERAKTEAENRYKQTCTKFGVKPAKTLEDLEDKRWLHENAGVLINLRNPNKNVD